MHSRRSRLGKFFADRGTHLAAMIAYFALLSFVPLALPRARAARPRRAAPTSRATSSTELKQRVPEQLGLEHRHARRTRSRSNATALGIIGAAFLLWSSLSLFSVLESAFNIVYGRPNRSFLHGKALAVVLHARARS